MKRRVKSKKRKTEKTEPFRRRNVYPRNIDSATPLADEPTDLFNLLSVNFI